MFLQGICQKFPIQKKRHPLVIIFGEDGTVVDDALWKPLGRTIFFHPWHC